MSDFSEIFNNKDKWIKTTGGISNDVYYYINNNTKFIIKILNKENNNLFVIFENYHKILENLDTTLFIDKKENIIIEKFIEGEIIDDDVLFSKIFVDKIYDIIDIISLQQPNIEKYNIILKYIKLLTEYLKKNKIFIDELDIYEKIFKININLEELELNNSILVFNHNDIQKFNIISKDKIFDLIDWEYSGYTFKYFDQCNFIVLLYYQYIYDKETNFINNFDFRYYINNIILRYKTEKKYIKSLMIISSYVWLLWSYVKFDKSKNNFYLEYKNKMIEIFKKILEI